MAESRTWRTVVRDLMRRRNYDVIRFTRMQVLRSEEIDVLLDVGANTGQFASQMRRLGYGGRIISFEPLPQALSTLAHASNRDPLWEVHPVGLGDHDDIMEIHVTHNLVSSSILAQRELLSRVDPTSAVASTQHITVRRLDGLWDALIPAASRVLLKIDTQGYERQVLAGCGERLADVRALHMEVSLVELYEGEFRIREALEALEAEGFQLATIEPTLPDVATGQLLQADLTLVRRAIPTS